MAPLKILIIGAGISGTSLTYWLSRSKSNHEITIVERFPSLRDTGLQLDLRGQGIEVLRRMGLEPAFRAKAVPEEGTQFVDSSSRVWAFFKANQTGKGAQSFTSEFEIMRGDLCRIIHDASQSDTHGQVKYIFGTTVTSFTEIDDDKGVKVTLTSSLSGETKTEIFDLLVGADGQNSHTRKMLLAQSQGLSLSNLSAVKDSIYYTGPVIAYFTIPISINNNHWQSQYMTQGYSATNRRTIITRRHNPSTIQIYLICIPDPTHPFHSITRGDVPREKEAMTDIYTGAGWKTEEILRKMNDDGPEGTEDFYCERMGIVQMDKWSSNKGHVIVMGDAAHAPTAFTGFGTTSAVVGAYVLAGEVEKAVRGVGSGEARRAIPVGLKGYDEVFRAFIEDVQKGVKENSVLHWWPRGEFGLLVLRILAALFVLLRLDYIGSWVLAEGSVAKWKLPDYQY